MNYCISRKGSEHVRRLSYPDSWTISSTGTLSINRDPQSTDYYSGKSVRSTIEAAFAMSRGRERLAKDVQPFVQNFNSSFTLTPDRTNILASLSELSHLLLLLAVAFEAEQERI